MLVSVNCFSQSKSDTEKWLTFYMNKYCGDDLNYALGKAILQGARPYTYTRHSTSFEFKNSMLYLYLFTYETAPGGTQKTTREEMEVIDLSKIQKIEIVSQDKTEYTRRLQGLYFTFIISPNENGEIYKYHALRNYVREGDDYKETTKPNSFTGAFSFYENDEPYETENLIPRMKKAFEHEIELCGGKVIKEIF